MTAAAGHVYIEVLVGATDLMQSGALANHVPTPNPARRFGNGARFHAYLAGTARASWDSASRRF
mgnify:CR=1 FL=1